MINITIPYYEELENGNRTIKIKSAQDNIILSNSNYPSYITPMGYLADIFSDHKNNNFIYPMSDGQNLLSSTPQKTLTEYPIPKIQIGNDSDLRGMLSLVFKDTLNNQDGYVQKDDKLYIPLSMLRSIRSKLTPINLYKEKCNMLYKRFIELKKNNDVNILDIMKYYNVDACSSLYLNNTSSSNYYSEEIQNNLLGIISGHIAIMSFFIKMLEWVNNSYQQWQKALSSRSNDINDMLVSCMGFDKIESQLPKTITTSKININETFFNYLILDWQIMQIPKFVIDKENRNLKEVDISPFSLLDNSPLEMELKDEIALIKKYVPYHERKNYFI